MSMCEECIKDMVAEGMDPELVSETVELFTALGLMDLPKDYLKECGIKSEFDLFGVNEEVGFWKVEVARIPEDKLPEDADLEKQWWALQGYTDGNLVVSERGAPPEPVTVEQAAKIYAEFHFNYEINESEF